MSTPDTRSDSARDISAEGVHALMNRLAESWDRSDADAYGACFTEDADYVVFDGTHLHGRGEIARSHRDLFTFFNTVFQGSRLVSEKSSVRFLTPEVALVHATGAILFPWQKDIVRARRSINTSVLVRQPDGSWLVAAFQNTRVHPRALPKGPVLGMLRFLSRIRSLGAR